MSDFSDVKIIDLLRAPYEAINELKNRGVVRTANSPLGDYAEYLVAKAFNGTLEKNSKKSFDVSTPEGTTYQVKARRMTGASGDRQLSIIRSWEFDFLIGVLFDADLNLVRAAKVPKTDVEKNSYLTGSTNGKTFYLRDEVWGWGGVEDVTGLLSGYHQEMAYDEKI